MADSKLAAGAQRRAQRLMQQAAKGHGAFMAKVGLAWAFPSLLAFSVGAFIKLAGDGLIPVSIATVSRIGATIILLISGVLALEIAFYSIGSAIGRRRVTWRIAWDGFLVVVVAPLETWTLYLLFTGQAVTGPIDLMRAAEAVVATVYLATLVIQPPSDREFVRLIGSRAGELTATKLELISLDAVGMGRLYQVQAVANDESLTWNQRAARLVSVMEELAPGEQERQHQQRLAELEAAVKEAQAEAQRDIAAVRVEAQRHIETAQRQIAEANTAATQRTLDAVLALVTTGKLPDWLIAVRPDLADFSLSALAHGAGSRRSGIGGRAPNSTPAHAPSSRADRQRAFLLEQGIEPSPAPKDRRGVWLRASDVSALMAEGRALASETPQQFVKRLGDGATVGRNLVAPFAAVMSELAERHLLSDAARIWWGSQNQSGEDAQADRDEMGRDISAGSRANVTMLRA